MALSISPEKGLFVKKTVYVDMDGVLVDFNSGVNRLPAKTWEAYKDHPEDAPGVFALMDPIPGAIDAAAAREALLRYCELDTLAMVKVWEKLKERI